MVIRICFCMRVACLVAAVASPCWAREWNDRTGRFSVTGELIKNESGFVEIRRNDGKRVRIPIEKLSDADQQFLRSLNSPGDDSPFTNLEPSQPAVAKRGDVQEVIANGAGVTRANALKDAFRAAVQQVVGTVVDAETFVKNDVLITDQVLTYSAAYVPKHETLSESEEDGIHHIRIKALVRRRSLIMKLQAANITTKKIAGKSLFGSITTQLKAEKDAAALVRKTLEGLPGKPGFPQNCVTAKVLGEPKLLEKDAENATLSITVVATIQPDAYEAFSKRLIAVLDAVAKRKGEFSLEASSRSLDQGRGPFSQPREFRFSSYPGPRARLLSFGNNLGMGSPGLSEMSLAVNTSRDRSFQKTEWRYFVVDQSVFSVLAASACSVGELKLSLLDGQDGVVTVQRSPLLCYSSGGFSSFALVAFDDFRGPFPNKVDAMAGPGLWTGGYYAVMQGYPYKIKNRKAAMGFIGPMFFNTIGIAYFTEIHHEFKVKIALDEVAAIQSAKVEVRYGGELPPSEETLRRVLLPGQ